MIWIVFALAAHAGNALVFVIDKSILGTGGKISQPARYAAYSGLVAGGAAVLLLISFASPTPFIINWSLIAGGFWVAALWFFFAALKGGEPSRVVPITGSAVPFFTLLFAMTVLGEQLTIQQLASVVLLIVGGLLLSIHLSGVRAVAGRVLSFALLGGAAFAAYFAVVKHIYDNFDPFLAAFAYTRVGVGFVAFVLLAVLWLGGSSAKVRARSRKERLSVRRHNSRIAVAFFGSKGLATAALLLLNYAIKLGSVTVVNALQGTQYMSLLFLTAAVSHWFPKLFREEMSRVALMQKIAGILFISLGLMFLL